jgi:hypothetical protein
LTGLGHRTPSRVRQATADIRPHDQGGDETATLVTMTTGTEEDGPWRVADVTQRATERPCRSCWACIA